MSEAYYGLFADQVEQVRVDEREADEALGEVQVHRPHLGHPVEGEVVQVAVVAEHRRAWSAQPTVFAYMHLRLAVDRAQQVYRESPHLVGQRT